jgi:hypothetical protein
MEITVDYNKNLLHNFCVSRTLYSEVDFNIAMAVKNFIKSLSLQQNLQFLCSNLLTETPMMAELSNFVRMSLYSVSKLASAPQYLMEMQK